MPADDLDKSCALGNDWVSDRAATLCFNFKGVGGIVQARNERNGHVSISDNNCMSRLHKIHDQYGAPSPTRT